MTPHLIIPGSIAEAISSAGVPWGELSLRVDEAEELCVVSGFSLEDRTRRSNMPGWLSQHYSHVYSQIAGAGFWYRATDDLHRLGVVTGRRNLGFRIDAFKAEVNGFRIPPKDRLMPVITYCPTAGEEIPAWMAWFMDTAGATRATLEVADENFDLLAPLDPAWPRAALANHLAVVIGVGSIGSSAAEALAAYGLRHLALVDHDRLHQHNFARHRVLPRELGRRKVNAVSDMLNARDPALEIERFPIDVIEETDLLRPLMSRSAVTVVCTDGVAARRVVNHLACREPHPVVFACVLEDGRLGEVLRVRPGRTACLQCSREALASSGVMSPEPLIDLDYGTGTRHRPMAAVGGDLDLVGRFATKVAVATLLEDAGYLEQRLPGDQAIIGLRPDQEARDPPFDAESCGRVVWHNLPGPNSDCPSCGSTA